MRMTEIAEQMVRREYLKKNLPLPNQFWNLPEYKKKYQMQLRFAAKFIRAYSEEAVTRVLLRESWCFSLAAKALPDLFEIEVNKIKKEDIINQSKEVKPKEVFESDIPVFRRKETKKTLLDE